MKYLISLSVVFVLISCTTTRENENEKSPYDQFNDEEVREVMERAIEYAGGIEQWRTLKTIAYTKRSKLILEGNILEYDITQEHSYQMQPDFSATIKWNQDSSKHLIKYSPEESIRMLNDTIVDLDPSKVKESAMSALFVLGMPFKLMDDGVQLSYSGSTLFMDSVEADVIQALYDPENVSTHSTNDLWWFYFEKESGKFLGSKVYHAPTYALIHNLSFTDTPIKFPKRRKSYRVDSLENIQFLRAEFWYSDFKMD